MDSQWMKKYLFTFTVLCALTGCAKPLPADREPYIGEWQAQDMMLRILPEGKVDYKRTQDGNSKSINAPIKKFEGDDFVVGVWFMEATFVVDQPPQYIDGVWTMTVDGVTLVKTVSN